MAAGVVFRQPARVLLRGLMQLDRALQLDFLVAAADRVVLCNYLRQIDLRGRTALKQLLDHAVQRHVRLGDLQFRQVQ